jgi:hypothetical protein
VVCDSLQQCGSDAIESLSKAEDVKFPFSMVLSFRRALAIVSGIVMVTAASVRA